MDQFGSGDQSSDENNQELDSIAPLAEDQDSVLRQVLQAKKGNPSQFPSYWEADEEDIQFATQEQIENDPTTRCLWAAENGKIDVLQTLLDTSPELVNAKDDDNYTPLHRASYEGHVDVVKMLLQRGADIKARTVDGWTPLHSACKWNNTEVASVLLQNSAEINAQTLGGQTPLHLAATNESPQSILTMLLMNRYIDAEIKNNAGDTAYDVCCRSNSYHFLFEICDKSLQWNS